MKPIKHIPISLMLAAATNEQKFFSNLDVATIKSAR